MEENAFSDSPIVPEIVNETFMYDPHDDWMAGFDFDSLLGTLLTVAILSMMVFRYFRNLYDREVLGIHPEHEYDVNEFRESENQRERRTEVTRRRIEEARAETNHECPICLAPASFPVLTDCGHVFCCSCIIGYWRHSKSIVYPCDCAICRAPIHMVLPVHWPPNNPDADDDDTVNDAILENKIRVDDYNRRFSNDRPYSDYLYDIPVLIPYMIRNFFNNDIFTIVHQLRLGIVLFTIVFYFLMPFDMIPESIYGIIGFLDDCVLAFIVIAFLIRVLRGQMADRGLANN